jgi:RNA polymerase sigma factor (sigma-70 family)
MEDLIISEDAFEEKIEDRLSLKKALDSLTPIQREVIKKVILEDRKQDEVAREMKISRQAVNRAKQRALFQLRNHFAEKISRKE